MKTWSATQTVIALSSGETEYYPVVKGCAEGLAIQSYCRDLGIEVSVRIRVDSSACKSICGRTGIGKLKHLDVQLFWLQDGVRRERVEMVKIRGDRNPADLMTKYLGSPLISANLARLGFEKL